MKSYEEIVSNYVDTPELEIIENFGCMKQISCIVKCVDETNDIWKDNATKKSLLELDNWLNSADVLEVRENYLLLKKKIKDLHNSVMKINPNPFTVQDFLTNCDVVDDNGDLTDMFKYLK